MKEIFQMILPTAVIWAVFLISFFYNRSRLRNCYYFVAALFSLIGMIGSLLGEAGEYVLLAITILAIVIILIVPFFLIFNGVIMIKKESRSLANRLSLAFGIFILLGEMAFIGMAVLPSLSSPAAEWLSGSVMGRGTAIFGLTVFYLSCVFVTFLFYTKFIEYVPHMKDFDYLIVHGAGLINGNQVSRLLADRCDKAIEVYSKDKTKPIIIPSGGQGPDETVSEAHAMALYMIEHGVDPNHIREEDQSPDTMTNVVNSKKIIDAGTGRKRTALITSNYHVYRCLLDARKAGLKCTGIGSHTASYYWPSALIREFIAVYTRPLYLAALIIGWLPILMLCLF